MKVTDAAGRTGIDQESTPRPHPRQFEQGPDVGAPLAAGLAYEAWPKVGKPDVIGPFVRADRNRKAALEVRAIDQEAADA